MLRSRLPEVFLRRILIFFILMAVSLRLLPALLQPFRLLFRQTRPPLVGDVFGHAAQVSLTVLREDGAIEHLEVTMRSYLNGVSILFHKTRTLNIVTF